MNNLKEMYYNEYLKVVTDTDRLEEIYISLKGELLYLFEEEPENLKEIEKVSSQIAKTIQKIKHYNNVINELKQLA